MSLAIFLNFFLLRTYIIYIASKLQNLYMALLDLILENPQPKVLKRSQNLNDNEAVCHLLLTQPFLIFHN